MQARMLLSNESTNQSHCACDRERYLFVVGGLLFTAVPLPVQSLAVKVTNAVDALLEW